MYYTFNETTKQHELRNSVGSTCKRHLSVGVLYSYDTYEMLDYGDSNEMTIQQTKWADQGKLNIGLVISKEWDLAVLNKIVGKEIDCEILNDGKDFAKSFRESYYKNQPRVPTSTTDEEEKTVRPTRLGRVDPWSL